MVAIRPIALLLALAWVSLSPSSTRAGPPVPKPEDNLASSADASLFAQSAAEALDRDFPSPDISFLLLDASTGRVLASRWDHPETPTPMGSLFKPFTALAYGERHGFQYPIHTCRGAATGCWLPRGHGKMNLTAAIAHSCNSYFRMLTADLHSADVSPTAARFGLDLPSSIAAGVELAGIGDHWRTSPLRMARAYAELARNRDQFAVSQILYGMAESAKHGTGAAVRRALPWPDVLVKTGTAACTHAHHGPGDGFAVILTPADHPQLLLLVRVHGVPGSHAAQIAGQMLHRIEG
jgi:cell division protein FtsI/penicillin-binding protein 2